MTPEKSETILFAAVMVIAALCLCSVLLYLKNHDLQEKVAGCDAAIQRAFTGEE